MGLLLYYAILSCDIIKHEGSALREMIRKKALIHSIVVVLLVSVFVSAIPLALTGKASAKTEYPVVKKDGLTAKLSKTYTFKSPNYNSKYIGKSVGYAYIYRKGKKVAKLKLTDYKEMYCIGKYNGRFYFNVRHLPEASAVYSYKLGDKKFKRVCKGLNFWAFKKKYAAKYQKKYYGIVAGRYIMARAFYPTDAYEGYGNIYVYDLKKNTKTLIGNARDVTFVGKKIYWTTTVPRDWARADEPKIVVNEATMEGNDIKTILSIPFKDLNAGYGSGTIDKHYITWNFMTDDGNGHATVKEKYR